MKTKFGTSAVLFVLLAAGALVLVPAASQAGTPPNDYGDHLWTRDRDQDCDQTCQIELPDQDRLQLRDRDRDRDCQELLSFTPPTEENGGNVIRHRIQERAQHQWYFFPGLALGLIWPGTF